MNVLKLSLFSLCSLVFLNVFSQNNTEIKKIEKMISDCVARSMAASVYIIEYDTLKNKVQDGIDEASGFTGVVVSREGHILTVSHAAIPNQVYEVRFPDGARHIAVGLGRIGIKDKDTDYDMAMIRILKPGSWPVAEMARAEGLKLNQPVISISYPGAFYKQTPNVRFGRITDIDLRDGFIESTARMEPGDSGGPLFDEFGRVVGIHSWIQENENQNYDVPVEHFLKYWTALNIPKDYKEFPEADEMPSDTSMLVSEPVKALQEIVSVSTENSNSVVQVTSSRGELQLSALGTVVLYGKTSYIISKSSMVGNNPALIIGDRNIAAQIVKRDKENDLVLLTTSEKPGNGIRLDSITQNPDLSEKDLGKVLVSPHLNGSKKLGVLSATYTDMPLNTSKGYLGASAVYADGKISVSRVARGSSVSSLLEAQDQIVKINGVEVNSAAEYNREFEKYMAGDSVSIDIIREGTPMQISVYLAGQPTVRHASFAYEGGRSARSDGFSNVLVYDATIKSDECGGPVFTASGEFYGINIARRSRTSSIILPVGSLIQFIIKD